MSTLSDEDMDKAIRDSLWMFMRMKLGVKKVPNPVSKLLEDATESRLIEDPNFASFLLAYVSLR